YGRQPIWKPVRANGWLLVTSDKKPDEVLAQTDAAERPYTLGIVPGGASFAGLWVYKDDHTDFRVLGALARILPQWIALDDAKAASLELARVISPRSRRCSTATTRPRCDPSSPAKARAGPRSSSSTSLGGPRGG